jgi:uncharacterized membrane protein
MTVFGLYLSVILCAGSLAWGFSAAGWTALAAWMIVLGVLWLTALRQNWDWSSAVGLLLAVIAAGFGLAIKLPPGWMFAGGLFALLAWDLNDFRIRLRLVVKDDHTRKMERRHILRVTLLILFGLALASLAMFIVRAKFTLEWAALLVLIVLLGLAQLVGWFKRQ